jgi:UDP-N-acetylmuramoyl-L-alanyl-D-glutamate--2,6-diaminopimelate ligase
LQANVIALNKILKELDVLEITGPTEKFIQGIQYDSRKIEPEQAFIAIKGFTTDGHNYIEQAFRKGARVFFVEKRIPVPDSTMVCLKNTRIDLAKIAQIYFNYPDKKLKIIGITGTNGKTTTAYMLFSILKAAHWSPGLISTIEYFDGKNWNNAERTTPESLDLFNLFHHMKFSGLKSVVMEVSSHSLVLHRVKGIKFIAGVFTNLGRDHLDFHASREDYFLAKRKLFEGMTENQKVVLNLDDPFSERIKSVTEGEIFFYSFKDSKATVFCEQYISGRGYNTIRVRIPSGVIHLKCNLVGEHNVYNLLAAITTAVSLGFDESFILAGMKNLPKIPGRSEFYRSPEGFSIYLDYAHTPEGIRKLLQGVWDTKPRNLIVVFGAGGDRDKGKRREMGKAAEDYADVIFLTNDNPRSEDPREIIEQILRGISEVSKVKVLENRYEAIWEALQCARKGDAVVIAGKGHERYQEINGLKIPFEDRKVLEEYFFEKGWELKSGKDMADEWLNSN